MSLRSLTTTGLLAFCVWMSCIAVTSAQKKVTVVTMEGESIRGSFLGASSSEVEIEFAGQNLKVPIEKIEYISFVEDSYDPYGEEDFGPLDRAFRSLAELNNAVQESPSREEYTNLVQTHLVGVPETLEEMGEEWPDVQLGLQRAVEFYQQASEPGSWAEAKRLWMLARELVSYSESLLSTDPEGHRENDKERVIEVGQTLQGRLGTGDRTMPAGLDEKSRGAFHDVYALSVASPSDITIVMHSEVFFTPNIVMLDEKGNRLEGEMESYSDGLAMHFSLESAGKYRIWVGATKAGHIGGYDISVFAE